MENINLDSRDFFQKDYNRDNYKDDSYIILVCVMTLIISRAKKMWVKMRNIPLSRLFEKEKVSNGNFSKL